MSSKNMSSKTMSSKTMSSDRLMDAPDRWIDLGYAKLPYWRLGQGPDLVFVHGWPLDSRTWRLVVSRLTDTFTCHLIDLPGAGRSQAGKGTPSGVQGMSDVLFDAIGQMEFSTDRFGLVGHDSGGTFARMAASRLEERVSGLVLGNTEIPGHHPWRLRLLLRLSRFQFVQKRWAGLLKRKLVRRLMLGDALYDTRLIEGELTDLFLRPLWESERALQGAMAMATTLRVEDFDIVGPAHARITAPVKLVWGARDPWFPLHKARTMLSSFAGPSALVAVDQAKLLVHEEHPERFAEEIRSHFSSDAQLMMQRSSEPAPSLLPG